MAHAVSIKRPTHFTGFLIVHQVPDVVSMSPRHAVLYFIQQLLAISDLAN
jgi:hypothetical protein